MSSPLRVLVACTAVVAGSVVTTPTLATEASSELAPAELLARYLAIDTSNPPGNEELAASFLADLLHREGISTRLLVSPGGRTNLYARLDGGPRAQGALVLMHHMDVVPPAPGWSVEPFSGTLDDGFIWGAGAVDDKSLGLAHLLAFLELARADVPLAHDVVLLAVSDEETGGSEGAQWLIEQHADLFADTTAVLTEGGGNRVFGKRTRWWGVEVAQKRPFWLEIRAQGRPGHGSTLDLHTAPHRLIRALDGLLALPREYHISPEARLYFERVAGLDPEPDRDWLNSLAAGIEDGTIEGMLRPGQHNLFLDTFQITHLDSGRQVNAIPATASALVDVRALPDTDGDALMTRIRQAVGKDVSITLLLDAPRVEPSPLDSPLYACLEQELGRDAPVIPTLIAGVTDARHFRRLGIPAYGFSPFAIGAGDAQGVHAVDERISRRVFEAGVRTMTDLLSNCSNLDEGADP